jgi:radical SAM superfamily enzyme YgiQ (UPF0313 family)
MNEIINFSNNEINEALRKKMPKKLSRILLINPPQIVTPFIDLYQARHLRYFAYSPYGLGILCTHLKKRGYEAQILDLNFELLRAVANSDEADGTYWSAERISEFMRNNIAHRLEVDKPDIVGISCLFTMTHEKMLEIAEIVRQIDAEIPICVGGVHPTSSAQAILRESQAIDFVALQEADFVLPDLFDFINGKDKEIEVVPQIAMLINDRYVVSENRRPKKDQLDAMPDYLDLPIGEYSDLGEVGAHRFQWRPNTRAGSVLSNRGCRAHCTFCGVSGFNGKGVRGRSVSSVVDEIEYLKDEYGISHIMWLDDDLFYDKNRTIELFNEITKRDLNITWDASNGVIASATTVEILDAAAASGCIGLHFGIESGNPKILGEMKKPSGVKHYLKLREKLERYPQIFTKGFLIIGLPDESLSQIMDTINVAIEMNLDWYTTTLLSPLPNTEVHKRMVDMGLISEQKIDSGKDVNFKSSHTGHQYRREEREKVKAESFIDLLKAKDLSRVPHVNEMDDLWFLTDFKINYARILNMTDKVQLNKLYKFMAFVSGRITRGNPMVCYFHALISEKLGFEEEAKKNYEIAKKYLAESDYWKLRFDRLGLWKD